MEHREDLIDLKGRNRDLCALVVGLGRSGYSALKVLQYLGATVMGTDRRELDDLPSWLEMVPYGEIPDGINLLVQSPGVPDEEPLIKKARARGIEIIGELELTYRAFSGYEIPWIAITGTNGKSTTTTLIDLMLRASDLNVVTGGNIGNPIGAELLDILQKGGIEDIDYIVVEVSSFQLETIREFRPYISVVLNITPDHLDRYDNMNEYIDTKKAITSNQTDEDILVLNYDDDVVREFEYYTKARCFYFSLKEKVQGAYLFEDRLTINMQAKQAELLQVKEMALRGMHNVENALAASIVATCVNTDEVAIKKVLREFKGLSHRMEWVAEIDGINFINDSKGTNVGALLKSLEGFSSPVVLIMGGRDKGGDFTVLKRFSRRIKAIVAIGEAKGKIKKSLSDTFYIREAVDMFDAVKTASELAKRGDTVLLCPGCASFDMFKNFEHRGEVFKNMVMRIKKDE